MLDDILVSDYINVNYWQWEREKDSNDTSSDDDWYEATYGKQD